MCKRFKNWREKRRSEDFIKRYKQLEGALDQARQTFVDQFVRDPILMDAYTKQSQILRNNERNVVVILITEGTFDSVFDRVMIGESETKSTIRAALITSGKPVGFLTNIPIYISKLMNRAEIFIVGDITWELKNAERNRT
jgi:hypothetical protein